MTIGLFLHVLAGAIGLLSGAVALFTRKGEGPHRFAGNIYFISMIAMAVSGFYLAALVPVYVTMLAASLTMYLVVTSWLTVRPNQKSLSLLNGAASLFGAAVLIFGLFLSWRASNGIQDSLGTFTVPAPVYYTFSFIVMIAVAGDLKAIIWGKFIGKFRIMRHLWRMCIPLYIAASSFFVGQEQVFPEPLQGSFYLTVPQYVVIVLMLFWLVRSAISKPSRRAPSSPG